MKKAFTLIELLVVIAIIGVLAALLLPSIQKAKEKSRQTDCMNNLRQFSMLLIMYRDEHDGTNAPWLSSFFPKEVGEKRTYICRSDRSQGTDGSIPNDMPVPEEKKYHETDDNDVNPTPYYGRNGSIHACSYMYEFSAAPCSWDYDGYVLGISGPGASWAEVKKAQLANGDAFHSGPYDETLFPIIRCRHHYRERKVRAYNEESPGTHMEDLTLNVAYAGNVFPGPAYWELTVQ